MAENDDFDAKERPTSPRLIDERDTVCPSCHGQQMLVALVDGGAMHKGEKCSCCDGEGIVSIEKYRQWTAGEMLAKRGEAD